MGILFSDIYKKAINLFDDPKITKAYKTNQIQFNKIMYQYLQNAIMMFNNPLIITSKLTNISEPIGTMEKFVADGKNNTFVLDEDFNLLDNSYYNFIQGELFVDGKLNKVSRSITFPNILPEGQEYAFEQYFPGEFLADFTNFNTNTNKINIIVEESIKNILARLLVEAWAEEERNLVLDIRNLLQDSDFKIMSNSGIIKSKNQWIDQLNYEITSHQNKLAWAIRFAGGLLNVGIGRG